MHALPLPPRHLTADRGDAGRRVDLVIRRHLLDLPTATRSRVQAWLEHGRVSINGRVVRRVSTRVALDDEITVELPDERPRTPVVPEEGQRLLGWRDVPTDNTVLGYSVKPIEPVLSGGVEIARFGEEGARLHARANAELNGIAGVRFETDFRA